MRKIIFACFITTVVFALFFGGIPVWALTISGGDDVNVWNGKLISSDVYTKERLPVNSTTMASDRISHISFVEQIQPE